MPDLDPNSNIATFAFTLAFKVEGMIDSDTTYDETKATLLERLAEVYGPGVELLDFRAASQSEVEAYMLALRGDDTVN